MYLRAYLNFRLYAISTRQSGTETIGSWPLLAAPAGSRISTDSQECPYGSGRPHVSYRPERAFLCQLVKKYYPAFVSTMAAQSTALPGYVQREFAGEL